MRLQQRADFLSNNSLLVDCDTLVFSGLPGCSSSEFTLFQDPSGIVIVITIPYILVYTCICVITISEVSGNIAGIIDFVVSGIADRDIVDRDIVLTWFVYGTAVVVSL